MELINKINLELEEIENIIPASTNKRRDKIKKQRDSLLIKYFEELKGFKVTVKNNRISLETLESFEEKREKEIKEAQEIKSNLKFIERVKKGIIEEQVKNFIEKNYKNYTCEHSKSFVKSESFYIKNKFSERVIKLSLHNTEFQASKYDSEFINLDIFKSIIELKKHLKEIL